MAASVFFQDVTGVTLTEWKRCEFSLVPSFHRWMKVEYQDGSTESAMIVASAEKSLELLAAESVIPTVVGANQIV